MPLFGFRKKSRLPLSALKSPVHLAVIMDGNGRWAKKRGLPRLAGHQAGAKTIRRMLGYCREAGVKYLTLYAFSTENWSRSEEEVSGLMKLLKAYLADELEELKREQVRFRVIGRREDLSPELQESIAHVEEETAMFERQLIVSLSYGGRVEIARAARLAAEEVLAGKLKPEEIDEKAIAARLYAPDVPDPDLIIRTSGELRVSNFLLWQCAYSEFFVTETLWPDFDEADFRAALESYGRRERRFGGRIGEGRQ